MVKIITLKKDFNNKEDNLYLKFDFDKSCSLSIIDKDVPHSIKRTKISSLFYGSIKINDTEYYFKSQINFIIVDNKKNTFMTNVSINQIELTNEFYEPVLENKDEYNKEDDKIECIIYELLHLLFTSNICKKDKLEDSYKITFNIPCSNEINEQHVSINNLSTTIKIGVFSNNL